VAACAVAIGLLSLRVRTMAKRRDRSRLRLFRWRTSRGQCLKHDFRERRVGRSECRVRF
jgi:hypothetical protein